VPAGLSNVVSIAAGGFHTLALLSDGSVTNWGKYWDGGLGFEVLPLTGIFTNIVAMAAGENHDLFLQKDGTLLTWGLNHAGQGDVPSGLTNIVAISAGGDHCLALRADGLVFAWGRDNWGQAQTGNLSSNLVAVTSGMDHNLALRDDGSLISWGRNDSGQSSIPSGLTNIIAFSAGKEHSLALIRDNPPAPAMRLLNPGADAEGFHFWLETVRGGLYRVEFKETLGAPEWNALPDVAGDGQRVMVKDPAAPGTSRFYRVRQMR
jgi:hypothetical protein